MSFEVDSYLDKQLAQHFAEEEASIPVSNCCGAPMDEDESLCYSCKEHCDIISQGEFHYNLLESAECDKADEERELRREASYERE